MFAKSMMKNAYRIFSIKRRTPIRHRRLIGVPAFIRGRGHKDRLQVNSNLLNGTVTTYHVRYTVLVF